MAVRAYTPSKEILEKYARVLVHFALGGGKGVTKGETVYAIIPEAAKPFLPALQRAVLTAGAHLILDYRPSNDTEYNLAASFYEHALEHHLDHFPERYYKGLIDQVDHMLFLDAETHPHALQGVDPAKILRRAKAMKPWMDWRRDKEHAGKFTWTIALYGTPQMAKEAGLSPKAYWGQIIDACFLNKRDPIATWKEVYRTLEKTIATLNKLTPKIERLHIEGEDADLWITPGKKRRWLGGSGRNIPSFELFTSPDWRGTQGWIRFNQPLYRYGSRITGIELWFEDGKVVASRAKTGEKLLRQMINTPGADRVGEFSLTDRRLSRITKFMAETLYDENMGGAQGNTHIALGASYAETYAGDVRKLSAKNRERLGFNDSSVHTDIISTAKRTVTAHLKDGSTKVIYDNGQFIL